LKVDAGDGAQDVAVGSLRIEVLQRRIAGEVVDGTGAGVWPKPATLASNRITVTATI
jgi:hypothetical protein